MWRPADWENNYSTLREADGMFSKAEIYDTGYDKGYEDGADAMLKGLISQTACPQEVYKDDTKVGILVFIPQEAIHKEV